MTYTEKIINIQTNEQIIRPYNSNEIAIVEIEQQKIADKKAVLDAENQAKEAKRQAVLAKLNLTAEEAAALLS